MNRREYKTSEEKFIRDNFMSMTIADMAKCLGRPSASVSSHIKLMGLSIPSEVIQSRIKSTQFKAGSKPLNAGTKGKPNATSFKAGQIPHNAKADGAITVRNGYKYIRIGRNQWMALHRYLWQNEHGPIPAGSLVSFIDGIPDNCVLENLELITRQQSVEKNRNRKKASETFKRKSRVRKTMIKFKKEFPNLFN
jgi:hypothetical protein